MFVLFGGGGLTSKVAAGCLLVSRPDSSRGESLANRVTFLGFQTVKSGRGGNGCGDDAKTGWLLSLLLYRFSEI